MSTPLLEVSDLYVDIPGPRSVVHAVRGATFSVGAGEALGLVGESGCGKSITLRAIMGLLPRPAHVVSGTIVLDGVELTGLSQGRLRDLRGRVLSMIFQEPMSALNPVMRVGDQIAEGPHVKLGLSRSAARRRALELMRDVGIPDPERRAAAYPHELSGGMRQRVMIAIALGCEPRLILCDEPTTALDVTIQDQILKLLERLQRTTGTSIVLVTHDLAVVAETCSSLAVMYAGQVLETGSVEEVFYEPRHPYTLGLLRSVPSYDHVREQLHAIPGAPPNLAEPPPGCPFHPRCPFVQDDCRSGAFPLQPLGGGRETACIHPDSCERSVREEPVIARA